MNEFSAYLIKFEFEKLVITYLLCFILLRDTVENLKMPIFTEKLMKNLRNSL
jgi:hypothetical protein